MFCRYYDDIDFFHMELRMFRRVTFNEFARTNPEAARGHSVQGLRRRFVLETLCGRQGQDTNNAERLPGCIFKGGDCSFLEDFDPRYQIHVQLNELPWILVAKAAYIPWCCTEPYSCYPHHLAALFGRIDLAKMMLDNEAVDVHAKDSRGNTALMLAAASGLGRTMVPFLSDMCKDENDRKKFVTASNNDGLTALHFAVLSDDLRVVEQLLDMGADPNAGQFTSLQDRRFALTPLHFALVKDMDSAAAIVEFLLKAGADASLEAATVHSTAPCAMFVSECRCGLCWSQGLHGLPMLLLPSSGAQYEGKIESVGSALHLAYKRGLDLAVWSILSEEQRRMLVNVPDGSGYLPLHAAVNNTKPLAVETLLSFGADINGQVGGDGIECGMTALHLVFSFDVTSTFSCASCYSTVRLDDRLEHIVTLLLKQPSVNVDARDCRGQTPLHVACKYGHHAFIERLVVCGASVLAADHEGRTPLSFASEPRDRAVREKIVDFLLRCGAASSYQSEPVLYSLLHLFCVRRDVAIILKLYRLGTFSSHTLNALPYDMKSVISGNGAVEEEEERNEVFARSAFKPNGCNPRSLYSQSIICVARQIRAGTPHSRREAFKSLELDPITLKIIEGLCLM